MKLACWLSLAIVFYTFAGYGILLYFIIRLKRLIKGRAGVVAPLNNLLPRCTLVVAAYNEEQFIEEKIENCLELKYPAGKLKFLFVTDGSTDKTPEIVARYPQITLLHQNGRSGKIAAVHRAMDFCGYGDSSIYRCKHFFKPRRVDQYLQALCR